MNLIKQYPSLGCRVRVEVKLKGGALITLAAFFLVWEASKALWFPWWSRVLL